MNPLMMLLGQQAAAPAAEETMDEILVSSNRGSMGSPGVAVDGMSAPNDRAIEAVQADVTRGQEASNRSGLFGMKGTLRDVLGIVGDAFLIQSGRAPIYAPVRRQEQISDAWAGAAENPEAAAERVGYYDAEMGQALLEKAKAAKLAEQKGMISGRVEDRQAFDDATKRISQAYAAVMQNPTPEVAAYALQLARNESETLGIPLERLGVTENMTNDVMRVLAGRGATVSQTMKQPLDERRVAVSEEQLQINKQKLGIALRGVKNAEARTKIAEQVLGLRRDDQQFDQMMDMIGISLDFEKERNDNKPTTPRVVPGSNPASRFRPASN